MDDDPSFRSAAKLGPDTINSIARLQLSPSRLRYSSAAAATARGWLRKEGRRRGAQRLRYFVLSPGGNLANHRRPGAEPTSALCLRGARVLPGMRKWEIVVVAAPGFGGGMGGGASVTLFASSDDEYDAWLVALTAATVPPGSGIESFYKVEGPIGKGVQSAVHLGCDLVTQAAVAIKVVERPTDPLQVAYLEREMAIVSRLSHPHIVSTLDIFRTPERVYFVQEYMGGNELYDFIAEQDNFSEAEAAHALRDVLSGIAYLHDADLAHRDIKLENILCANRHAPLAVKIADFGFTCAVRGDAQDLHALVGTSFYLAPELIAGTGYGRAADCWAVGVTMYLCLSGHFPYGGEPEEYYEQVLEDPVYFPEEDWATITPAAKHLIRRLMDKDPAKRATAAEALAHPWFRLADSVDTAAEGSLHGRPSPNAADTADSAGTGATKATAVATSADKREPQVPTALPVLARFRKGAATTHAARRRTMLPSPPLLPDRRRSRRRGRSRSRVRGGLGGEAAERLATRPVRLAVVAVAAVAARRGNSAASPLSRVAAALAAAALEAESAALRPMGLSAPLAVVPYRRPRPATQRRHRLFPKRTAPPLPLPRLLLLPLPTRGRRHHFT
ncbi:hypothetical protein MMPV_005081 [Pyropia vietnamensis]